jgi:hypothetical protein
MHLLISEPAKAFRKVEFAGISGSSSALDARRLLLWNSQKPMKKNGGA